MTDDRAYFARNQPETQFSEMAPHHADNYYVWYKVGERMYPVFRETSGNRNLGKTPPTPKDADPGSDKTL